MASKLVLTSFLNSLFFTGFHAAGNTLSKIIAGHHQQYCKEDKQSAGIKITRGYLND
jgi:hypothetical protein